MVQPIHSTSRIRTLSLTALLFGALLAAVSTPVQAAAPTLVEVVFEDSDDNGFINRVKLVFSEDVDDSTFRAGDFRVTGDNEVRPNRVVSDLDGSTADDDTIWLTFFENTLFTEPKPDTAETPDLTYTPGTAEDAQGEALAAIASGDFTETDQTPPVLMAAAAQAGDTEILLIFSEPVAASSGGALDASDLCYTNGDGGSGGTQAITDAVFGTTTDIIVVTVDTALVADDIGADTIQAATGASCDTATLEDTSPAANPADPLITATLAEPAIRTFTPAGGSPAFEVSGQIGSEFVTIRFNMPVQNGEATPAALDHDDFQLVNNPNTLTRVGATHAVGTAAAVLELSAPLTSSDIGALTIDVASDTAVAAYGNELHADGDIYVKTGNPGTVEDRRAPRITDVAVESTTADGFIDIVAVTFDENVDDGTSGANLVKDDWTLYDGLDTVAIEDVVTDADECDGTGPDSSEENDGMVFLCVDAGETLTRGPTISYTDPGSTPRLTDLSGVPFQTRGHWVADDGVAPRILSASTLDADTDGKIDGYTVTFSEPVDDSTFTAADWKVGGTASTSMTTGAAADDATIVVVFAEASSPNTDATPQLTYTGTTMKDLAGNLLAAVANDDVAETDAAPPVLVSAVGAEDQDQLTVTFSEPVRGSGTSNAIVAADLTYTGGSTGATAIESVDHTAGDKTAVLTLDAALTSDDDGSDTVAPTADVKEDKTGGLDAATAAATVATTDDVTPPGTIDEITFDADETTPNSLSLMWTAPEGDDIDTYQVRYATEEITSSNVGDATSAASGDLDFDPDPLAAEGDDQAVTVSGLVPDTEYFFAVRAVDDAGNEADWTFSDGASTDADTTPPTGTLDLTTTTHADPSADQTVEFNWTAATDDESEVTYRYALTRSASHSFTDDDETTTEIEVTLDDVGLGTFTFHLRAESPGGNGPTDSLTIHVRPTKSLGTLNADLQGTLEVRRSGGDAVLTWDADAVDPKPTGIQIWRSTSPFAIIATLVEGDAAFDNETYVDEDAPDGAAYIITAFYGDHEELGKFGDAAALSDVPGYEDMDEAEARQKAVLVPAVDDGLPTWLWVVIVVIVILVVAGIIVAVVLATRKREPVEEGPGAAGGAWAAGASGGKQGWEGKDEWEGEEDWAIGEQTHHMTCPRCDHDFTAAGMKPMTTTCPNCHVKGVLR